MKSVVISFIYLLVINLTLGQSSLNKLSFIVKIEKKGFNKKTIDSDNLFFLLEKVSFKHKGSYLSIDGIEYMTYFLGIDRLQMPNLCCADTTKLQPLKNDSLITNFFASDYFKHGNKIFIINSKKWIIKIISFIDDNNYCRCSKIFADVSDYSENSSFACLIKPIKLIKLKFVKKKNFKNNIIPLLNYFEKEYNIPFNKGVQ